MSSYFNAHQKRSIFALSCDIKKSLGIDYKFESGGVRFFQPQ